MKLDQARLTVRDCLKTICPDTDLEHVSDHTPLLKERVITSFQVLDLILHLERARGRPVNRTQLQPGSFSDIATLAQVFLEDRE